MQNIFRILFTPPILENEQRTRSARYLTSILNIVVLILLILALSGQYIVIVNVVFVILAIATLAMHFLIHAGRINLTTALFSFITWGSLTFLAWVGDGVRDMALVVYLILIFFTSLLGSPRLSLMLIALSILSIWSLYYAQNIGLFSPISDSLLANTFSLTSIFILFASILYFTIRDLDLAFSASIDKEKMLMLRNKELLQLQKDLEDKTALSEKATQKAELQASRLQRIATIIQQIVFVQGVDSLLAEATKLIGQNFGFYHVGVFLLSADRKSVELKATNRALNEETKQELLADRSGVINKVARNRQAQIVHGEEFLFNLSDTRSQIAFPLIYGGTFFGVLDIHSSEEDLFKEDDIEVFMTLANQLALVMENTRQFESANLALAEMEEVSQQYLRQEWTYLRQRKSEKGYRYAQGNIEPITESVLASTDSEGVLNVPVKVRNQIVGMLQIRPGKEGAIWSEDDVELVETIADRVALAIENARLLEDTAMQAGKEGALSQFATTISNVSETEKLMSVAVRELRKILDASEVSFELKDTK